jgi:hypothetical protein
MNGKARDINSLEYMENILAHFRQSYPLALLCTNMKEVAEINRNRQPIETEFRLKRD